MDLTNNQQIEIIFTLVTIVITFWATGMQPTLTKEEAKCIPNPVRWFIHPEGGICWFGKSVGLLMTAIAIVQLVLLLSIDSTNKTARRRLGYAIIGYTGVPAITTLLMNSYITHRGRSVGIFEKILPAVILQSIVAYMLIKNNKKD